MFEQILQAIQAHDTIILHRHSSPDGDALGSQLGLKHIIQDNFPGKLVYAVGDPAGRYAFMPDSVMDDVADEIFPTALSIVLDCGAAHLISDKRYTTAHALCRIDHHIFCEQVAPVEVVDPSSESCSGLIAAMALECGLRVSPLAAQLLYTGMVTDSGRFRYDSTSAQTFRMAAFLMEQPINTEEIYRNLYANDLQYAQLRARFTMKIQLTGNGAAYIYTTREELDELGADTFSISRGMVNVMADLRGVDRWVNFTETDSGILCELRSSRLNINPIAVKYGGGGHAKASGATVQDRHAAMDMLRDLDQLTGETHDEADHS